VNLDFITSGPTDDVARNRAARARMSPEERAAVNTLRRARAARAKAERPEEWRAKRDKINARRKNYGHQTTITFADEEMDQLRKLSKKRGMSINELVCTYVTWGLETDGEID
jgi:hypothetical protein